MFCSTLVKLELGRFILQKRKLPKFNDELFILWVQGCLTSFYAVNSG